MEKIKEIFEKLVELMGFSDFSVSCDEGGKKLSIFINDSLISEKNISALVNNFDCLAKLVALKIGLDSIFVDINNYRKKRESLILELARAAARKVVVEKQEISLPPMNAYERRLVHMDLASRPDIKTESSGEGSFRCIVIKPIES